MKQTIGHGNSIRTAVAVHVALTRELDWLRIAARVYKLDVYRRLVRYSASNLHWAIDQQLKGACVGVQFRVRGVVPQESPIEITIEWAGRCGEDVSRALSQVMTPLAKA